VSGPTRPGGPGNGNGGRDDAGDRRRPAVATPWSDSRHAAESVADDYVEAPQSRPLSLTARRAWAVLWSSFLMAGVLEAAVFALVDPQDLRGVGGAALPVSRPAVYTLAFLLFWVAMVGAGALAQWLLRDPRAAGDAARHAHEG
jgi:hypothetical protein